MRIFNNFLNKLNFKKNNIIYPKTLKINGRIRLVCSKNSNILLGENITINSSWKSNPAGGGQSKTLFYVKSTASLKIGKGAGISNTTIVCHDEVNIEENVNIGVNCIIYDTDFYPIDYNERLEHNIDKIVTKKVTIKNGAWIGGSSIILKGVTIGEKSIIGAGSVVTKDAPSNEIWAGNPARFIKNIESCVMNENKFN